MARALGRYELLRPLARGGMAEVYLARRRAAGIEKWLVVKRMRPERSGDPRFLDLFVREARLSMSLAHQNIVPVFDFGKIDDQVFLAMERVEGKDLGSSLARAADHRLPPLLAAFIAAECCQALDYAHQRKGPDGVALGIVHRDVTPRNVLLSWSGEVKLTDFGIAALAGDAHSRLLGTPQYMAPEQARSEAIDPRADIYAIGLVLRETITGRRPRPGTDRDTILEAARKGELLPWDAPADATVDEAPEALIAIIDRATAAAADDRYADVRAMLDDLDSFMVGQRAAHKADSPARQLAAWLASVWDGARDDLDSDVAIDAEHLVSFLDDGALDVLGTGTMRSMAATAAEDVHAAPSALPAPAGTPRAPTPAAGMPAAGMPRAPTPAAGSPRAPTPAIGLPRVSDGAARRSRVSSSNVTVASGSFHTIPEPGSRLSKRPPRLIVLGTVASAAAAAVVIVVFAGKSAPPAGIAAGSAGSSVEQRPVAGQMAGSAGSAAEQRPVAGQPDGPVAPLAAERNHPPAGHAHGRPLTAEPADPGQLRVGRPVAGQPVGGPGQPTGAPGQLIGTPGPPGSSISGSGVSGQPSPSVPGSDTTAATGSDHKPGTCRVRINLTPWAYYTADDDTVRHETPGTIELTPGPHRLHVWNPELHVERDITISVPADRDAMNYSEPLQPTTLPPGSH